jgi:signal transduction histidine kinase
MSMQLAPTPPLAAPVHGPKPRWSSWRRLPTRRWAPLLALLLPALALLGGEAVGASRTRVPLLGLAFLNLLLVAALTRLLLIQAARQTDAQRLAEGQARELARQVESRTRDLAALATRQQQLAEAEKARLARRLHDELGGLLTAAKMDLAWLQPRVVQEPLQGRLARLGGLLDQAMDTKRRAVEELRPSLLDHFGLMPALTAHLQAACGEAGLACELDLPQDCTLPPDTAITLFRIIQEGLTNTLRHAGASTVTLQLSQGEGACEFRLSDDGCGFDTASTRGSPGLMAMQHRARSLGGELTLSSAQGKGTTLTVTVPAACPGR